MECINSILGNMNLWNDLSFSLYTLPSVCYVVTTLDDCIISRIRVSANLVLLQTLFSLYLHNK